MLFHAQPFASVRVCVIVYVRVSSSVSVTSVHIYIYMCVLGNVHMCAIYVLIG